MPVKRLIIIKGFYLFSILVNSSTVWINLTNHLRFVVVQFKSVDFVGTTTITYLKYNTLTKFSFIPESVLIVMTKGYYRISPFVNKFLFCHIHINLS